MQIFADTMDSGGSPSDWIAQLVQRLGAFHPLVVHFPIALLLTAALLEAISVWKKDHSGIRFAIVVNLTLGMLGAVVAATLGWMDAAHIGFEPDLKPILVWHRWLGTSVAVGSVIVTALWFRAALSKSAKGLWVFRFLLWSLAILLGITGHLGGLLVYGLDYFSP